MFTTAQVPIFPPVVAAKLTATVDHISNGRFAINVVCGHAGQALEGLVGAPELDHDEWYAYADEWIEILDRLWSEPDIFDYAGRFFNLKGAGSYPKPLQQPRPPIMNAGNSDVGQRWAARHSDMMFTSAPTGDYAAIKAKVDHIRGIAAEYGRDVEVWMSSSIVVRPTERDAFEYLDWYAVDHADFVGLASLQRDPELSARLHALPADERKAQLRRLVAGSFNMQILVGTPEQLVDRLINLSRAGVDGLNMTFVNYQDELRRVVEQVIPLLEQAGLRQPFRPDAASGRLHGLTRVGIHDLAAGRRPHSVTICNVPQNVLEQANTSGRADNKRMQRDAHHSRVVLTLFIQHVKCALHQSQPIEGSKKRRPEHADVVASVVYGIEYIPL